MVDSLKALPAAVRAAVGPMADRGEDFNPTDVIIKPAPGRRFIRAGETGGRWFVWYEQGGIAYWKQILILDGGKVAVQSRSNGGRQSLRRDRPPPGRRQACPLSLGRGPWRNDAPCGKCCTAPKIAEGFSGLVSSTKPERGVR